jgi:DNA-binding PadR family transcriptional regulator
MVNLRRDMIKGLVRLRVLHAAAHGPVSGVDLSNELAEAGHHTSPGTLYPLLHQMEKAGWLKSTGKTVKGKRRRYYRLTKRGRAQLEQAVAVLKQVLAGMDVASAPSGNGHLGIGADQTARPMDLGGATTC